MEDLKAIAKKRLEDMVYDNYNTVRADEGNGSAGPALIDADGIRAFLSDDWDNVSIIKATDDNRVYQLLRDAGKNWKFEFDPATDLIAIDEDPRWPDYICYFLVYEM